MTARTHDATDRLVSVPHGKVWIEAWGEIPGAWVGDDVWEDVEHRPVEVDGLDRYVRVPADETASKADFMALAATVAEMEDRLRTLTTRLAGVAALLDLRNTADG